MGHQKCYKNLPALWYLWHYKLNFFAYSRNIYGERNYNFKFDSVNVDPYELIKINNDIIYSNNLYLGFIPKSNSNYKFYG